MAGRSMPGSVLMHDLGQRQQRAGVAGGDHAGRLAAGHRIDRHAHRGAAHPQRGGRLHVVADRVRRVPDGADGGGAADGAAAAGASSASSPTSRKRAPGWRSAAISRPSITMCGRVVAAHGVDRQREGCGQGRTRGHAACPGVRRGQRPSVPRLRRRPRARRSSRNGCRRGAGRFNSPQLGHSAWASRGSASWLRRMPRRDGEVFRFGTAMGQRPSGLGDALRPESGRRGRSHSLNNARGRRLAEGPAGRKGWANRSRSCRCRRWVAPGPRPPGWSR